MSNIVGPMDEKSVKKCPGWVPIVFGILALLSVALFVAYQSPEAREWVAVQWDAISGDEAAVDDTMMVITIPRRAPILTRALLEGKYQHIIEQGQTAIDGVFKEGSWQAKGYYQYGGLLVYEIYGLAQEPLDGSPEYWLIVFVYDSDTDYWHLVDVYQEMTVSQIMGTSE